MISLFDQCYALRFRALREQKWEKETAIATDLKLKQQEVSDLLNGKMHYTEEIIAKISGYYKITISAFKKLDYNAEVAVFVQQLTRDAGTPFNDQATKIRNLELSTHYFRKENRRLTAENSNLKWKLEKKHQAEEILSQKIKSSIYVAI